MRGFTLIELISIMLIVGILAVFAVGRLDFSSTFDQKGVRDKAIAGLQFARKTAAAQRRNVCVCVGTKAGATCTVGNQLLFTIDTRAPEVGGTLCNGSSESAMILPVADKDCAGGSNRICSKSGAAINIFSGGPALCFDAQGRALNSACTAVATVVLTVTGQSNITVEGDTGYVH